MKRICSRFALVATLALATTLSASAALPGYLIKSNNKTKIKFDDIRWIGSRDAYSLTVKRSGGTAMTTELSEKDVSAVKIAAPASLKKIATAVQKGERLDEAVPLLQKMVKDYQMLGWDVTAGRFLADALMQQNKSGEAVEAVQAILKSQPKAYAQAIVIPYWSALLKEGKTAKLNSELDKSVKIGSREVAARAQNLRGDMAKSKGDYERALMDGYLRTWLMYRNVPAVQPEALAKAAECFRELNQVHYVEKMRDELLTKYPGSTYAKELK